MKRIYIIGYMGAGKSTLGKSLALHMNLKSIDTDRFIENRYRKKISEIFAAKGEEHFREIEHRVLQEVSEFEDVIISTGGGLPCFHNNMKIMNDSGVTVYIEVPVEELVLRLNMSKNVRPVLNGRSGNELKIFVEDSLNIRKPFYEQAQMRFHVKQTLTKNDIERMAKELESI